ncbi:MAG: hypothetical protein WC901_05140 [Candidatus Margulisiibacteriota bacterium]
MKRLIQYILIAVFTAAIAVSAAGPVYADWDHEIYNVKRYIPSGTFSKPLIDSNGNIYLFYTYESGGTYYLKYLTSTIQELSQSPTTWIGGDIGSGWTDNDISGGVSSSSTIQFDAAIDDSNEINLVYYTNNCLCYSKINTEGCHYLREIEGSSSYTVAGGVKIAVSEDTGGGTYYAAIYAGLFYDSGSASPTYNSFRIYQINTSTGGVLSTKDYGSPTDYIPAEGTIAFDQNNYNEVAVGFINAYSSDKDLYLYGYNFSSSNEDLHSIINLPSSTGHLEMVNDSNGYYHITYLSAIDAIGYCKAAVNDSSGTVSLIVSPSSVISGATSYNLQSLSADDSNNIYMSFCTNSNTTFYKEKESGSSTWLSSIKIYGGSGDPSINAYLNFDPQGSMHLIYTQNSGTDSNLYYSADDRTAPSPVTKNNTYYGIAGSGTDSCFTTAGGINYYTEPLAMRGGTASRATYTNSNLPIYAFTLDAADYFSGVDYFRLIVDDSSRGTVEANSAEVGNYTITPSSGASEGFHEWKINTYDHSGNTAMSNTYEVYVDTTAPNITVATQEFPYLPLASSYGLAASSEVTITWTANDPELETDVDGSGLASFEVTANGSLAATPAAGTRSYTLSRLNDGNNKVTVEAYDNVRNSRKDSVSFLVDTYAPVISVTHSTTRDGGSVSSATGYYHIVGSASDVNTLASHSYSGLKYIYINLYDRATGDRIEREQVSLDGVNLNHWNHDTVSREVNFNTTFSDLTVGSYSIEVEAWDFADHLSTATMSFEVGDITAPTITIASPDAGATFAVNEFPIRFRVTDAAGGDGIQSLWLKTQQGSTVTTTSLAITDTAYNLEGLKEGALTITLYSTDCAGNTGYASRDVIIDLPALVFSYPTSDATLTQNWATVECNNPASGGSNITSMTLWLTNRPLHSTTSTTTHFHMADLGYTTTEVARRTTLDFTLDLQEGINSISMEARDAVGNYWSANTGSFSVVLSNMHINTIPRSETLTNSNVTFEVTNPGYGSINPLTAVHLHIAHDGTTSTVYQSSTFMPTSEVNSAETFTFERDLHNATYTVTVDATDGAGNTYTDDTTFTVAVPGISIITPADHSRITHNWITAECTNPVYNHKNDLANVTAKILYLGTGTLTNLTMTDLGLTTSEVNSASTFTFERPLLNGDYQITVEAVDDVGNRSTSEASFSVYLPGMVLTLPSTSTVSRITVQVSNPVYNSINPLASMSASVQNGSTTTTYSMSNLGLSTEALAASALSFELNVYDGTNTISVEARDSLGNIFTVSGAVVVNLPDIDITSPVSQSIVNASVVTVQCSNAIGSVNPLVSLTAQVSRNGTITSRSMSDLGLTATAVAAATIQFNLSLSDGLNNVTVEATDSVGNITRDSVLILVDTQMPVIACATPDITTEVTSTSITWLPSIAGTVSDTNVAADVISGLSNISVAIYAGTAATGTAAFTKTYYADTTRTFSDPSTYTAAQNFSDELREIAVSDTGSSATYTMVVTAADFAGNTTTETQTFTITPDATSYISSISASPSSIIIEAGSQAQLSGYIYGYHGSVAYNIAAADLTWSVDNSSLGSIDTNGTFTSTGASGNAVVTAAINGYTASITVNIIPATLTSISINPATVEVNNGETAAFTLIGYDSFGNAVTTDISDYPISWNINSSAGTLTVPAGDYNTATLLANNSGTYTLTASYTNIHGAMTASSTVTISLVPVSRIEISGSTSLIAGDDYTMTVTAYESDGTVISDLSVYNFTWSLVSGGTLSSSSGSSVTLTAGNTAGTYTLSVACDYASPLTNEATLTIFAGATNTLITDPDLSTGGVRLTYGDTQAVSVTAMDGYGNPSTIETVTINSADTTDGALYGSNSITIAVGGLSSTYTYTVIPDLTSVEVSATDTVIAAGEQLSLSFVATDSRGTSLSISDLSGYGMALSWSTTGGSVSSSGLFIAPSADGKYTVTVSYANADAAVISDSIEIQVSSGGPTITVSINDAAFNASNNYIVNDDSSVAIDISDANAVNTSTVTVTLDGTALAEGSGLSIAAVGASVDSLAISLSAATISGLADGSHTLTVSATDLTGAARSTSVTFTVYGSLSVIGTPMNYPNPFSPANGTSTTIRYNLTQDADIIFMIYDIVGNRIYRWSYSAGATGGSSGQNEITWNGISDFGTRVGNGVYIYFILSGAEVLGSGEMAVYN